VQDLLRVNGKWQLTQPTQLSADPDTVGSMVSSLSSLNADKLIEDKAADLQPYGLQLPDARYHRRQERRQEQRAADRDDTPTGSGAYAKLAGDPRVFTVASFTKTSLDKTPTDLRDKRLLTFDSDKLTRVVLQAKGTPSSSARTIGTSGRSSSRARCAPMARRWKPSSPSSRTPRWIFPAPSWTSPKTSPPPPRWPPWWSPDAGGNQTLEVRRDKDKNCYARSSAVEGTYKVASDLADTLDKNLDDFRNKKLFDFGFSDPSKVELKTVTYVKSGDKWDCRHEEHGQHQRPET